MRRSEIRESVFASIRAARGDEGFAALLAIAETTHHGMAVDVSGDAFRAWDERYPPAGRASQIAETGPRLWAELHGRAIHVSAVDDAEVAWLGRFRNRIPCGECRWHWDEITAQHPPGGDYFAWTVAMHNQVSERLGKPTIDVDAARLLWAAR